MLKILGLLALLLAAPLALADDAQAMPKPILGQAAAAWRNNDITPAAGGCGYGWRPGWRGCVPMYRRHYHSRWHSRWHSHWHWGRHWRHRYYHPRWHHPYWHRTHYWRHRWTRHWGYRSFHPRWRYRHHAFHPRWYPHIIYRCPPGAFMARDGRHCWVRG